MNQINYNSLPGSVLNKDLSNVEVGEVVVIDLIENPGLNLFLPEIGRHILPQLRTKGSVATQWNNEKTRFYFWYYDNSPYEQSENLESELKNA